MTKITKTFTERALFCPEYATAQYVQMSRYFGMLKTEIQEFVSTKQYLSLLELYPFAWWSGIEIELQTKEKR